MRWTFSNPDGATTRFAIPISYHFKTAGGILEDLIHAAFSRSPESAELTICSESAALEFRVSDCGPSVALEQRAQMITDDLAFTKRAVETLGGTLWMESNAPRGAVVCFVLPMGN